MTECSQCVEALDELRDNDPFVRDIRAAARLDLNLTAEWEQRIIDLAEFSFHGMMATGSNPSSGWKPHLGEFDVMQLLSPRQESNELGRLDRFRILGKLGQGGMGIVLNAYDPELHRHVALKLMLPQNAQRPNLVKRFEQEARALAAIHSDYVVDVYSVGSIQTEFGRIPYLSMPLLRGETLSDRLLSGPLPVSQFLDIAEQIALGLAAIHGANLIHRDIKPGNLWLEYRDPNLLSESYAAAGERVIFLDFGIVQPELNPVNLTHVGEALGTPAYMAPEQVRGERSSRSTDLFSLGAVYYEMATGQRPFHGNSRSAVQWSVVNDQPADPSSINPAIPLQIESLINKLLEKDAARRPQSAASVVQQLHRIRRNLATKPRSVPSTVRYHSVISLIAFGLVFCMVTLGVAQTTQVETPRGTLVINSDDPDVVIRITQAGTTIIDRSTRRRFQLRVGEYGVELVDAPSGTTLSANRVTLTRNKAPIVTIVLEPPDVAAKKVASPKKIVVDTKPSLKTDDKRPPLEIERQAISNGVGVWTIVDDELVQTKADRQNATLVFGNPEWTDYDFSFEAQRVSGTHGFKGIFHQTDVSAYSEFAVGNYDNTYHDQSSWRYGHWKRQDGMCTMGKIEINRWHAISLKVRGAKVTSYLDGVQMFATDDPAFTRGRCGVGVFDSVSRFRNFLVTAPDGTVLWKGLPELSVPAP